jgi:hypothetical protein
MSAKSQKEILDKFNLSDMTSNLCLDKRLYSRELSKAERSKHDKFQASGSPGSPGFSTGSRQEYLESIIDYLTPDDVRCLIRAEDELVQATHFSRIFPTQVSLTLLKNWYYLVKVSKFQNELMKSSFLPKYESNIVRISALYCATQKGRNPYNFWFIFCEKRCLHKFILKFTNF